MIIIGEILKKKKNMNELKGKEKEKKNKRVSTN